MSRGAPIEREEKLKYRKYREQGLSPDSIAACEGVHRATVLRALAELREELGPEQIAPQARRFFRGTVRHRSASTKIQSVT